MKYKTIALTLTSLGWFLLLAGRYTISTLLVRIEGTLGIDHIFAGWAMSSMWLVYGLMQFPSGILSDLKGEKFVLVGSILVSTSCYLLLGITFWPFMFLGVLILLGFGTGFYQTAGIAFISDLYTEGRGKALGIQSSIGSMAGAFSVAAPLVVLFVDWRTLFFVLGGLGVLLLWRFAMLKGEIVKNPGRIYLLESTKKGLKAMKDGHILSIFMVNLAMAFVWIGFLSFYPTFLIETKNFSELEAGVSFAVLAIGGIMFKPVIGALGDRYDKRCIQLAIILLATTGLGCLIYFESFVAAILFSFVLSVCGSIFIIFNSQLMEYWSVKGRGGKLGFYRTANILVTGNSAILTGYMGARYGFETAFLVMVATMGVAALFLIITLVISKKKGKGSCITSQEVAGPIFP